MSQHKVLPICGSDHPKGSMELHDDCMIKGSSELPGGKGRYSPAQRPRAGSQHGKWCKTADVSRATCWNLVCVFFFWYCSTTCDVLSVCRLMLTDPVLTVLTAADLTRSSSRTSTGVTHCPSALFQFSLTSDGFSNVCIHRPIYWLNEISWIIKKGISTQKRVQFPVWSHWWHFPPHP